MTAAELPPPQPRALALERAERGPGRAAPGRPLTLPPARQQAPARAPEPAGQPRRQHHLPSSLSPPTQKGNGAGGWDDDGEGPVPAPLTCKGKVAALLPT